MKILLQKRKLAAVLLIAIVVRLGVLLALPSVFAFEDTGAIHGSEAYDTYARNLLDTGTYGRRPAVSDAQIPPFYSYALAGVYGVFGRGHIQVGVFHTLLDVISIGCLYHICKRLMPHGLIVGLLAGLMYALYPYLVFQNLTLIDTPLFMTQLYIYILLMVLLRERGRFDRTVWGMALAAGVMLGLTLLTRPIIVPFAVFAALWFLYRYSFVQTVARLLPVALVSLLVITPWMVRNYRVFNAFVPIALNSGENFYQGNNQYTVAIFNAGYDVQWTPIEPIAADDPYSPEANAQKFALGWNYVRQNPGAIPELLWTKFKIHWSIEIAPRNNPITGEAPRLDYNGNPLFNTGDDGSLDLTGLPEGDPVNAYSQPLFEKYGRDVHVLYYGGLFLLALVGIALTVRQRANVSLLWFAQISMTLVYLMFHPSTRYRVPTDPLLFVFAAYALVALWLYVRARQGIANHETTINHPAQV